MKRVKKALFDLCMTFAFVAFVTSMANQAMKEMTPKKEVEQVVQTVKAQEAPKQEAPKTIEQMIRDKFGKDGDRAVQIARCESSLMPDRIGDDYPIRGLHAKSVGLFQVRLLPERGLTEEQMKNPQHNIDYAYMLYQKYGWKPWLWCSKNAK